MFDSILEGKRKEDPVLTSKRLAFQQAWLDPYKCKEPGTRRLLDNGLAVADSTETEVQQGSAAVKGFSDFVAVEPRLCGS